MSGALQAVFQNGRSFLVGPQNVTLGTAYGFGIGLSGFALTAPVGVAMLTPTSGVIIYSVYDTTYGQQRIYGVGVTVSGTTISFGSATNLALNDKTVYDVQPLTSTTAVVYMVTSLNYMEAVVVTLSGGSVSAGTRVGISTGGADRAMKLAPLSSTSFVAPYVNDSDTSVYARACTVSGTTITVGANTAVITTSYTGSSNVSAAALSSTSGFIVSRSRAVAFTVSGTTLTLGSQILLGTTSDPAQSSYPGAAAFNSGLGVATINGSGTGIVYAYPLTISGTTVTVGTKVAVTSVGSGNYPNIINLTSDTTLSMPFSGGSNTINQSGGSLSVGNSGGSPGGYVAMSRISNTQAIAISGNGGSSFYAYIATVS